MNNHTSNVSIRENDNKYTELLRTFPIVYPLIANMVSTSMESPQGTTSIASFPTSMNNTPMKLLDSPLCTGSLSLIHLFIKLLIECVVALIYFDGGRGISTY